MLNLKKYREEKGVSQVSVARDLGISRQTYNNYELGKREADYETLLKLAEYFNTTVEKLLIDDSQSSTESTPKINGSIPYEPQKMIPIPVVGKVAAGYTCLAETDIECYELVDADTILNGYDYIYLRVKGDSMEPEIKEGDLVLVRIQSAVEDKDFAVVIVDDEDGLVKQIELDTNKITLISKNPYYPPREFNNEDTQRIRFVGKVIESKRKFA